MIQEATDREKIRNGVEIFVNIARMLFETLEAQVFKVKYHLQYNHFVYTITFRILTC